MLTSRVYTRTRASDFACGLSEFAQRNSLLEEHSILRWFGKSGTILLSQRAGQRVELWLRSHDRERKDLVGQRPILCIACVWSEDKDATRLKEMFGLAITDSEWLTEAEQSLFQDAARAEEDGAHNLDSPALARLCEKSATSRYEHLSDRSLQRVSVDNPENRKKMASLSCHKAKIVRLAICEKSPPEHLFQREGYVLLPEGEVEPAKRLSKRMEPTFLDVLKKMTKKIAERPSVLLLLFLAAYVVYLQHQVNYLANNLGIELRKVEVNASTENTELKKTIERRADELKQSWERADQLSVSDKDRELEKLLNSAKGKFENSLGNLDPVPEDLRLLKAKNRQLEKLIDTRSLSLQTRMNSMFKLGTVSEDLRQLKAKDLELEKSMNVTLKSRVDELNKSNVEVWKDLRDLRERHLELEKAINKKDIASENKSSNP